MTEFAILAAVYVAIRLATVKWFAVETDESWHEQVFNNFPDLILIALLAWALGYCHGFVSCP